MAVLPNNSDSFSHSVVQVPTAIPAFIGYTPKAEYLGKSYLNQPFQINSMAEFLNTFGFPPDHDTNVRPPQYTPYYYLNKLDVAPKQGQSSTINGSIYSIEPDPNTIYYLYNSIKLFFDNGGSRAYIVSVGSYGPPSGSPIQPGDQIVNPNVKLSELQGGLETLKSVEVVTMYVFPEATLLKRSDNSILAKAALNQCGFMQTAISLFDVIGGHNPDPILWRDDVQKFRDSTGSDHLDFGVTYYPFLHTTAFAINQVTYKNINAGDVSKLYPILDSPDQPNLMAKAVLDDISNDNIKSVSDANAALGISSKAYKQIQTLVLERINTLPPSGIMAGLYAKMDSALGVWNPPANVNPIGVVDVTIRINDADQQNLNLDPSTGKSINAFRFFDGKGVLVWGARTLDGNSRDWRYIVIRRLVTMITQSAKLALRTFVFEPNDNVTWESVKSSLTNFLTNLWKEGALQGTKPQDAFMVNIGLGVTMTVQDILDGILRVNLLLAVNRPSEFIVVTIEQELATSSTNR